MTDPGLTDVKSDNAVTRRERERQSAYRQDVLGLPAGGRTDRGQYRELGNYLPADDTRHNFLSAEAGDYAAGRVPQVRDEGGTLEQTRLFTNMLSSMPLAFSVFGHLRAHPAAALAVLSELMGEQLADLVEVSVGDRVIHGIECEWAPRQEDHLDDRTAFDAVVAARTVGGRSLLIAVEVKYVDTFSRDPHPDQNDHKYEGACGEFGMADGAFQALKGHETRQLLRNVLLSESVRRGGRSGSAQFDDAVTIVFARDDDVAAKSAVSTVDQYRGSMRTRVAFVGHGDFAEAAARIDELAPWARSFRRRYVGEVAG
jgi:hypothetical protein